MSIASNLLTYPAYFNISTGVAAILTYDTAIVAYSGGTIEMKSGFLTINALRSNAVTSSKQRFEKQLNANIELIYELKKLIKP